MTNASPACCAAPRRSDASTDLGHAGGFDVVLTACAQCGADWADLFCEAAAASATVPIDRAIAARLRALAPGPERKAALKAWLAADA